MSSRYDNEWVERILSVHSGIENEISERLDEFREIWEKREGKSILMELLFCILTPQSKAKVCWGVVEDLECENLILKGDYDQVLDAVGTVRFKYRKASYILEAREKFMDPNGRKIIGILEGFDDDFERRDWLVENVKGYGYKEASHFLRNIGLGRNLAILDRHILKNLERVEVIPEIPRSMTSRRYLEIEGEMAEFADVVGIPLPHLDLVLWHMETGEIFK